MSQKNEKWKYEYNERLKIFNSTLRMKISKIYLLSLCIFQIIQIQSKPVNACKKGFIQKNQECVCDVGKYLSQGECIKCPILTYKDTVGNQACIYCKSFYYPNQNRDGCEEYPVCPELTFRNFEDKSILYLFDTLTFYMRARHVDCYSLEEYLDEYLSKTNTEKIVKITVWSKDADYVPRLIEHIQDKQQNSKYQNLQFFINLLKVPLKQEYQNFQDTSINVTSEIKECYHESNIFVDEEALLRLTSLPLRNGRFLLGNCSLSYKKNADSKECEVTLNCSCWQDEPTKFVYVESFEQSTNPIIEFHKFPPAWKICKTCPGNFVLNSTTSKCECKSGLVTADNNNSLNCVCDTGFKFDEDKNCVSDDDNEFALPGLDPARCEPNQYSKTPGGSCENCPSNFVANDTRTACKCPGDLILNRAAKKCEAKVEAKVEATVKAPETVEASSTDAVKLILNETIVTPESGENTLTDSSTKDEDTMAAKEPETVAEPAAEPETVVKPVVKPDTDVAEPNATSEEAATSEESEDELANQEESPTVISKETTVTPESGENTITDSSTIDEDTMEPDATAVGEPATIKESQHSKHRNRRSTSNTRSTATDVKTIGSKINKVLTPENSDGTKNTVCGVLKKVNETNTNCEVNKELFVISILALFFLIILIQLTAWIVKRCKKKNTNTEEVVRLSA